MPRFRNRWFALYARLHWRWGIVDRRTTEPPLQPAQSVDPKQIEALQALGMLRPDPPPFVSRLIHRSFFLGPFELRILRR